MPISFNGTTQRIDLGSGATNTFSVFRNISQGTLMGWFYPTNITGTFTYYLVDFSGNNNTLARSRFTMRLANAGAGAFLSCGGNSRDNENTRLASSTAGSIASANTWYHIAVVNNYAADTISIYLNGALLINQTAVGFNNTVTQNTPSDTGYIASNFLGTANYFPGYAHDVRTYNRALSTAEIGNIYYSLGTDHIINGLFNRYILSENTSGNTTGGATIIDVSFNKKNGTPANTPTYVAGILRIR